MRQTAAQALLFACLATLGGPDASARDARLYPEGPVKLVVGFVPGGPTDLYARIAASALSDGWGQQVVVENRPGGSGAIAARAVAAAEPDGYTLLVNVVSDVINPIINKKSSYDLQRNFVPIGLIASAPNVLVVNPELPADSMQALVAYARKHPNALSYASAGIGTVSHLAGALLVSESGIDVAHVPYKGTAGGANGPAVGPHRHHVRQPDQWAGQRQSRPGEGAGRYLAAALAERAWRADHGRGRLSGGGHHVHLRAGGARRDAANCHRQGFRRIAQGGCVTRNTARTSLTRGSSPAP